MVVHPVRGSSLFKDISNVRDLNSALVSLTDISAALAGWSDERTDAAHQKLDLGTLMENAFIWNPIDLGTANYVE
jgi:hypothetical protein